MAQGQASGHFQPRAQFGLTFPMGTRLWRQAWDASPFKSVINSDALINHCEAASK